MRTLTALLALFILVSPLSAAGDGPYTVEVLVDGYPVREYAARQTTYVEALRERSYSLRVTNPSHDRVAVALSVDGLNTIDARHTTPWDSSKWVIEPYSTITIDGWQVGPSTARSFFFTGERSSYGATLGKTANLGVIEAVFFRERPRPPVRQYQRGDASSAPSESRQRGKAPAPSAEAAASDDYAATGMGERRYNEVERVDLRLEPTAVASIRIRYEFRPELVRLGVVPSHPRPDPMRRREAAQGFAWCPDVD